MESAGTRLRDRTRFVWYAKPAPTQGDLSSCTFEYSPRILPLEKKPQKCGGVELASEAREDVRKGFHTRKLFESRGGKTQSSPAGTRRILLGRKAHLRLQTSER